MTRISTISLMIANSCFREGAGVIFRMLTTWNQIHSHHVNQYSKWPSMQCYRCDMYLVYRIDDGTYTVTHIKKTINICNHRLISDFVLAVQVNKFSCHHQIQCHWCMDRYQQALNWIHQYPHQSLHQHPSSCHYLSEFQVYIGFVGV